MRTNLIAHARASLALHTCERVGRGARCFGKVYVENAGAMRVGDGFALGGARSAVHVAVAPNAMIGIGDDVTIEYGSSISARSLVAFGHRVRVGPHCVISDATIPLPLALPRGVEPRAIMVGDDVWIGARVIVKPGIRIGHRAIVAPDSVVTSDLPDDALAAGNPARSTTASALLLQRLKPCDRDRSAGAERRGPVVSAP